MKNYFITAPVITCLFLGFGSASCSSKTEEKTVTAKDINLSEVKDTADKKQNFFDFMRPIIIQENNKVLALRKKLVAAKIYDSNKKFVAKIAKAYQLVWSDKEKNWTQLLERVDSVSLEVALAQSANESAWGQSRFAQQGNNFFGQWCYKKGCGIVPTKRASRSKHEVARYNSVNESVRSYIKNINTTRAYAPLRKARKQNRDNKKPVNAKDQASGLIFYSQRRGEYVKEIIQLIQSNQKLMTGKV